MIYIYHSTLLKPISRLVTIINLHLTFMQDRLVDHTCYFYRNAVCVVRTDIETDNEMIKFKNFDKSSLVLPQSPKLSACGQSLWFQSDV